MNKDRSNFFDYLGNLYFGTYQQTTNFKSSLNLLAKGIWRIGKKNIFKIEIVNIKMIDAIVTIVAISVNNFANILQ